VSDERLRWAEKARTLQFEQLDIARRHAESWRTGLAGVTALLGAVLVVKGRDTVTGLALPYRIGALAAFGTALVLLVTATLTAIRAASGEPGDDVRLNGEEVKAWTVNEVQRVGRAVRQARALTVAGVAAVVTGTAISALAPATDLPLVSVDTPTGRYCGQLTMVGDRTLRIGAAADYRLVPYNDTVHITIVSRC
jgi:hypothetical protein